MTNENELRIEVRDKIATLKSQNFNLVGGNSDYDVVFDFDEDWADVIAKTAIFIYGKSEPVYKVFDGNVCEGVAITDATMCLIGVVAGDVKTTTPACVECIYRSITDEANGVPQPPTEDVYNQIMELLNKYIQQGGVTLEEVGKSYLAQMQILTENLRTEAEANGGNIDSAKEYDRAYIRRAGDNGKDSFICLTPTSVPPRNIWELGEGDLSIPVRKPNGQVAVAEPFEDEDAVPKGYADLRYVTASRLDDVESIAKGAQQALSFFNYKTMITELFKWDYGQRKRIGQSIYIGTLNVPDLWVSDILNHQMFDHEDYGNYVYTTDEDFVKELTENGYVQIGVVAVSALETGKVNLENYYDRDAIDNMFGDIDAVLDAIIAKQNEVLGGNA